MKTKKRFPVSLLVAITVSAVLLLTDLGLGIFFTIYSANTTSALIKSKIMENAYTAAALLDANTVGELTIEDKENNTERYQKAYTTLASFKTSSENNNGELAYIYLLAKIDGKTVFSVDPCDDPGEFLVEQPIYTEAMEKAFLGVPGVDDQPYTDRWGKLYSGYAPVTKEDGSVVAVVGVDVWADYLDRLVIANSSAVVSISLVTIALGVGLSLLITYSMRRKIRELDNDFSSLEEDIQSLVGDIETPLNNAEDAPEIILKGEDDDQLTNIRNKLYNLRGELKRYMDYANKQALVDRLTRVANRNAYSNVIREVNEKIKNKTLENLVVGIYDVNGLKTVNDSTGHETGDILLKVAAQIIHDAYGHDDVYRIGGDEFVIVFNGSEEEFKKKDDLCTEAINKFNDTNRDYPFILSLSLGYSTYNKETDHELLDIFRRADKNMYEAKNNYYKHKRHSYE